MHTFRALGIYIGHQITFSLAQKTMHACLPCYEPSFSLFCYEVGYSFNFKGVSYVSILSNILTRSAN